MQEAQYQEYLKKLNEEHAETEKLLASEKEKGAKIFNELSRVKQELASQTVEHEELLRTYRLTEDQLFTSQRNL